MKPVPHWKLTVIGLVVLFLVTPLSCGPTSENTLTVKGDVNSELALSIDDLRGMPEFYIRDVAKIAEKVDCDEKRDEQLSVDTYTGVLLRDLLYDAGMEHRFKWEPGVYIVVHGTDGERSVFSFGEIFYSSIGRSVLVAHKKNNRSIRFKEGTGKLMVSTDIRSGRWIPEISEIEVRRVGVEMKVYDDQKQDRIRPMAELLTLKSNDCGSAYQFRREDLEQFPTLSIASAVMTGDCEGFGGVYDFEGPPLRELLDITGIEACSPAYDRFVLVESTDGFCATFSFGEIYNSRLSNNIAIAIKKDGEPLDESEGFARSVVGEDSTGGRAVRRVSTITLFTAGSSGTLTQ